jgi:hypothetical protein
MTADLVTRLDHLRRLEELRTLKRDQAALRARRYLYDPVAWARDCIAWPKGGGLAVYQEESLNNLIEYRRVAKRGPHGLGKTTDMSVAVLWFALTRDLAGIDWKVITTASVWRQLQVYLWPEIHKWAKRIRWDVVGRDPFNERTELLDLQLKLDNGAATAVASDKAERIEGAHADEILYIVDEAKIVPAETWDAIEGALSNAGDDTEFKAYVLAMSTPGPPSGRFYDIHQRKAGYEDWHTRHVKLAEAVAAGRISQQWADQRKRQWGEDSALYKGRVLGEFHAGEEDSVIPLSWVEAAVERWHEWVAAGRPEIPGPRWIGVDVGRGGDESVFARRMGHVVTLTVDHGKDTMTVVDKAEALGGRSIVDVVGVGAGVYDRMRQKKLRPLPYAGAGKSTRRDRSKEFGFVNVRSAAYWYVRELLDPEYDSVLALPPDDLLISDLITPTWDHTAGNPPKIKVQNKEDVVEILKRSPDRGDAVVMSLFADAMRSPVTVTEPSGGLPTTGLSPLGR